MDKVLKTRTNQLPYHFFQIIPFLAHLMEANVYRNFSENETYQDGEVEHTSDDDHESGRQNHRKLISSLKELNNVCYLIQDDSTINDLLEGVNDLLKKAKTHLNSVQSDSLVVR